MLGDDTRAAQALADETAARDAARTAGQESIETGDPTDLFSAARMQGDLLDTPDAPARGMPDEGAATGYVTDADYEATMIELELLEAEAGGLTQVARVTVDDSGQQVVELLPAGKVLDDIDATEAGLAQIEVCTRAGA